MTKQVLSTSAALVILAAALVPISAQARSAGKSTNIAAKQIAPSSDITSFSSSSRLNVGVNHPAKK